MTTPHDGTEGPMDGDRLEENLERLLATAGGRPRLGSEARERIFRQLELEQALLVRARPARHGRRALRAAAVAASFVVGLLGGDRLSQVEWPRWTEGPAVVTDASMVQGPPRPPLAATVQAVPVTVRVANAGGQAAADLTGKALAFTNDRDFTATRTDVVTQVAGGASMDTWTWQSPPSLVDDLIDEHFWYRAGAPPSSREQYAHVQENPWLRASEDPLSTFSIDVDTASYANVRRILHEGRLPDAGAVRIEEMLNYFRYAYPDPAGEHPFSVTLEVHAAPWQPEHRLVRIGLKAREIPEGARPASNLVFLVDVSGAMDQPDKLPLVQQSLRMLVDRLTGRDRVALCVYAGAAGLVLPSTSAAEKGAILEALDRLQAGGSTAGAEGIELAYQVAQENYIEGGVNRVLLCTDGDFNVGVSSESGLVSLIEEKREGGVFLSVLGFGTGNYADSRMEQLSNHGNGNAAYIDSLQEARKVLVEQAGGTLVTVAKDVKIQVEFNPERVAAYRLVGYENRLLAAQDFNDDKKDAGEIGAGHTVTALYEVIPPGVEVPGGTVDPLKYGPPAGTPGEAAASEELLTVKLRYKQPEGDTSTKLEVPLVDRGDAARPSADFDFVASVASFGMLLRGSTDLGAAGWALVEELARSGLSDDRGGYRAEFLGLVREAARLAGER